MPTKARTLSFDLDGVPYQFDWNRSGNPTPEELERLASHVRGLKVHAPAVARLRVAPQQADALYNKFLHPQDANGRERTSTNIPLRLAQRLASPAGGPTANWVNDPELLRMHPATQVAVLRRAAQIRMPQAADAPAPRPWKQNLFERTAGPVLTKLSYPVSAVGALVAPQFNAADQSRLYDPDEASRARWERKPFLQKVRDIAEAGGPTPMVLATMARPQAQAREAALMANLPGYGKAAGKAIDFGTQVGMDPANALFFGAPSLLRTGAKGAARVGAAGVARRLANPMLAAQAQKATAAGFAAIPATNVANTLYNRAAVGDPVDPYQMAVDVGMAGLGGLGIAHGVREGRTVQGVASLARGERGTPTPGELAWIDRRMKEGGERLGAYVAGRPSAKWGQSRAQAAYDPMGAAQGKPSIPLSPGRKARRAREATASAAQARATDAGMMPWERQLMVDPEQVIADAMTPAPPSGLLGPDGLPLVRTEPGPAAPQVARVPVRGAVRPSPEPQVPMERGVVGTYDEPVEPARAPRPVAPAPEAPQRGVVGTYPEGSQPAASRVVLGRSDVTYTPRNTEVGVQYAVVPMDEVIASQVDETLDWNPAYDAARQARDRTRPSSRGQVAAISQGLKGERVGSSPETSSGAPIVGPDMMVESGNARTLGMRLARNRNTPAWAQYQRWLVEQAEAFGVSRADIERLQEAGADPILVRVRRSVGGKADLTPEEAARFASEAGESPIMRMSDTEVALEDARRLRQAELFQPDAEGRMPSPSSPQFVQRLMAVVPEAERGEFQDARGKLSAGGLRRIQRAIMAYVYDDAFALSRAVEETDDNTRNIGVSVRNVAPKMAVLRQAVERGAADAAYDIRAEVAQAANAVSSMRARGLTGEALRQAIENEFSASDLFGGTQDAVVVDLARVYAEFSRSSKAVTRILDAYLDAALMYSDTQQGTLLGGSKPTRAELFRAAYEEVRNAAVRDVAETAEAGPGPAPAAGAEGRPVAKPVPPEGGEPGAPDVARPNAGAEPPAVDQGLLERAREAIERRQAELLADDTLELGAGLTPKSVEWAALEIARGTVNFADWAVRVVEKLGPMSQKALRSLYRNAAQYYERTLKHQLALDLGDEAEGDWSPVTNAERDQQVLDVPGGAPQGRAPAPAVKPSVKPAPRPAPEPDLMGVLAEATAGEPDAAPPKTPIAESPKPALPKSPAQIQHDNLRVAMRNAGMRPNEIRDALDSPRDYAGTIKEVMDGYANVTVPAKSGATGVRGTTRQRWMKVTDALVKQTEAKAKGDALKWARLEASLNEARAAGDLKAVDKLLGAGWDALAPAGTDPWDFAYVAGRRHAFAATSEARRLRAILQFAKTGESEVPARVGEVVPLGQKPSTRYVEDELGGLFTETPEAGVPGARRPGVGGRPKGVKALPEGVLSLEDAVPEGEPEPKPLVRPKATHSVKAEMLAGGSNEVEPRLVRIGKALGKNGRARLAYPWKALTHGMPPMAMEALLRKHFEVVHRMGGSDDAPVWEFSGKKDVPAEANWRALTPDESAALRKAATLIKGQFAKRTLGVGGGGLGGFDRDVIRAYGTVIRLEAKRAGVTLAKAVEDLIAKNPASEGLLREAYRAAAGLEKAPASGAIPKTQKARAVRFWRDGAFRRSAAVSPVADTAMHRLAAAPDMALLKGVLAERDVLGDLSKDQTVALGRYLVGRRLQRVNPDHPQALDDAALSDILQDRAVAEAVVRHRKYKREVEKLRLASGLDPMDAAGQDYPDFVSLIHEVKGPDGKSTWVNERGAPLRQVGAGPGGSLSERTRLQKTSHRMQATGDFLEYSIDYGVIIKEAFADASYKAAGWDLFRTLRDAGLTWTGEREIATYTDAAEAAKALKQARATAEGTRYRIGEAKTGEWALIERQAVAPKKLTVNGVEHDAAKLELSRYGTEGPAGEYWEDVYVPKGIAQDYESIVNRQAQDTAESAWGTVKSGVTGLTLTANSSELWNHARKQMGVLAAVPHGWTKARWAENSVPYLGPKVGTLLRMIGLDFDRPDVQAVMKRVYDANAGSSRAFQEQELVGKGNLDPRTHLGRLQHWTHGFLFGVPEGKGVRGWDIRVRVLGEMIREAAEGNTDPKRVRDFANRFGQYTQHPDPFIRFLKHLNPFAATQLPMRATEFSQFFGGSGLKSKRFGQAAGRRVETFYRGAGGAAIALVLLNKLIGGRYPWENPLGRRFDVYIGKDDDGQEVYLKARALDPLVSRVLTSVNAGGIDREREARREMRDYPAAVATGVFNQGVSMLTNPVFNTGIAALTGTAPYLMREPGQRAQPLNLIGKAKDEQGRYRPVASVRSLRAAVEGLHPALGAAGDIMSGESHDKFKDPRYRYLNWLGEAGGVPLAKQRGRRR